MSDFTILRIQDCNHSVLDAVRNSKRWIFFWTAAIFLLFLNLGTGSISGSEGRWLAVAKEMMQSGDYLHPTINGTAYFDKPLVSYWLIVLFSLPMGEVTELSARMPSAVSAIFALLCVVMLARSLFDERTALLSGWVMMTVYSFAFWGRLAEADMENMTFILMATAWYVHCRKKAGFFSYALFWGICGIGAQTKGLAAIVIPVMVAGTDMLLNGTIKKHLCWQMFAGALFGAVLYVLPFVLEMISRGDYGASGFVLVFRENIMRAVNPWDHKSDPCWIYFVYLPRLLLPWTPFFVLALVHFARKMARSWKTMDPGEKWLLISMILIFFLFSASRSRRVYYILPIVPFCAILTGRYLALNAEEVCGWLRKITEWLFLLIDWLLPVAAGLCLFSPFVFRAIVPHLFTSDTVLPNNFVALFYFGIPAAGLLLLSFWIVSRKRQTGAGAWHFSDNIPTLDRLIPSVFFCVFLAFSVIMPEFQNSPFFRTQKQFFLDMHRLAFDTLDIPPSNTAFFGSDYSYAVYYLDLPQYAKMFDSRKTTFANLAFTADTVEYGGPEEFRAFLEKAKREGGAVLGRFDAFLNKKLPDDLRREFILDEWTPAPGVYLEPESILDRKVKAEAFAAWENGENPQNSRKIRAYSKIIRKKMLFKVFTPVKKTE